MPAIFYALLYVHRRYVVLFGALLTFFLYALVLTAHGMPAPRFVVDPAHGSLRDAGGFSWRRISDALAGRRYVVLAFDQGPYGYGLDEQIMATLRKHNAHAVFLVACQRIGHVDRNVLGELEDAGHLVGHQEADGTRASMPAESAADACGKRLAAWSGRRSVLIRAPLMVQSLDVRPLPLQQPGPDSSHGPFLLRMHETPDTAAALDGLLATLEQRGFQFVLPEQPLAKVAID